MSIQENWRNRGRRLRMDRSEPKLDSYLEETRKRNWKDRQPVDESYYNIYPAVARARGLITEVQVTPGSNGTQPEHPNGSSQDSSSPVQTQALQPEASIGPPIPQGQPVPQIEN